jgi:hypothetical protein
VIAAILAIVVTLFVPASASRCVIYLQNDTWYSPRAFGLFPIDFAVAPSGDAWCLSSTSLIRFDGRDHTYFSSQRLGTSSSSHLRGGIAFRNQEVWAAHEEGVLRFDGRDWHLFPEALKTSRPESIAANRDGVWVVDDSGNLSHFDGTSWVITDLNKAIPSVFWGNFVAAAHPKLALTSDGALWIVWGGLWRFDGRTWRDVPLDGGSASDAALVSQEPHRLWLLRGNGALQAAEESGEVTARHTPAALGLASNSTIRGVAAAGNLVYVGTSEGLIILGDGIRQRIPGPGFAPALATIALAPGGAIFALADTPRSFTAPGWWRPQAYRWILSLALIPVLFVMRWWQRRRRPSEFPAIPSGAQPPLATRTPHSIEWVLDSELDPPLVCPSCAQSLAPATFVCSAGGIQCGQCGCAIALQRLAPAVPKGISVTGRGRDWTLDIPARSTSAIVWGTIGLAMAASVLAVPTALRGASRFFVPLFIAIILFKAAFDVWGHHVVRMQGSTGTVFTGFRALGVTQKFSLTDLTMVCIRNRRQTSIMRDREIVLTGTGETAFGQDLSDTQRVFIAVFVLEKCLAVAAENRSIAAC